MNKYEIEQIKQYYSVTNDEFEEMYLLAKKLHLLTTYQQIISQ